MKWKTVFLILLALVIGWTVYYCTSSLAEGRTDYALLKTGKQPIHATTKILLTDGGTSGFNGRGYAVYDLQRFVRSDGTSGVAPGYLRGYKLEWRFPMRVFARDQVDSLCLQDDLIFPDDVPNNFSSERELKEKVQIFAKEWQSYTVAGREYIIGRLVISSTGTILQRITCWRKHETGGVTCVWNVYLT